MQTRGHRARVPRGRAALSSSPRSSASSKTAGSARPTLRRPVRGARRRARGRRTRMGPDGFAVARDHRDGRARTGWSSRDVVIPAGRRGDRAAWRTSCSTSSRRSAGWTSRRRPNGRVPACGGRLAVTRRKRLSMPAARSRGKFVRLDALDADGIDGGPCSLCVQGAHLLLRWIRRVELTQRILERMTGQSPHAASWLALVAGIALIAASPNASLAPAGAGPAREQRDGRPDALRASILVYHRFGPVVADSMTIRTSTFRSQLQYLKDHGYRTVPLRVLVAYLLRQGRRRRRDPS